MLTALVASTLFSCSPAENSDGGGDPKNIPQSAVTVGYQGMLNPWKAAIHEKEFEKVTGRELDWRKFSSGSEVISAMASGDVQLAVAGSSPIATAMSRGMDVELVWVLEAIENNEALVARKDTGIKTLQDLKGKTIGVPFASTTHYHLLFALEHNGMSTKDVTLLNLQPDAIAASWAQDRIDAAFVWSPVLDQLKKNGEVILTSGELAALGRPTFDGIMAQKDFGEKNPEFMAKFLKVIADRDASYRDHPEQWTVDSTAVKAVSQFSGATPEDVVNVMQQYDFPTLEAQVSERWLGGTSTTGAPQALADTSKFLKAQQSISEVLPDYAPLVNPAYARAAMALQ